MLPIPIETLWSTPITRIQAEQLYVMQFRFFLRPNVPLLHVFFFSFLLFLLFSQSLLFSRKNLAGDPCPQTSPSFRR